MKNRKWLVLLFALVMTLSVALTGCTKKNVNDPTNNMKGDKDKNQVLNLILLEPRSLDPNKCTDTSTHTCLAATQEALARVANSDGKNDKIIPAGAEKWDVSKDGTVWTFTIRDNKWSDGQAVTAQHYADSIIRMLDKEQAFPYAFFLFDIKNAKKLSNGECKPEDLGVKVKDAKTLEITLEKATPYFEKKLAFTTFIPIRLDVIKNGGENWDTDITKQVYCGPFVIAEWVKNNSMKFTKNPNYWDKDNVALTEVNMKEIPEFSTQAQLFESKQLDVTGSKRDYLQKWADKAKAGEFKYFIGGDPSTQFINFNCKNGGPSQLMQNKNIRLALSLSIDRPDMLNVLYSRYTPAYGLVPQSLQMGEKEYRSVVTEPLKALYDQYNGDATKLQELFKKGLKELNKDTADLKNIKLVYTTYGTSSSGKEFDEYLQQTWEKKLGITVEISNLGDYDTWYENAQAFKFDITTNGWKGDYNDPLTFMDMWTSTQDTAINTSGFANDAYDKKFAELDKETDNTKRQAIYTELEKILVADEAAIAPYMYGDTRRFIHNYVQNFQWPNFGPSYEWRWCFIKGKN